MTALIKYYHPGQTGEIDNKVSPISNVSVQSHSASSRIWTFPSVNFISKFAQMLPIITEMLPGSLNINQ